MADKKSGTRFTIQFTQGDPLHEHVADILNRQGRRKAKFIADAVLFYEQNNGHPVPTAARIDTKTIKRVVARLLAEKGVVAPPPSGNTSTLNVAEPEEMMFDSAAAELDPAQIDAIAGAIQAFRRK